MNHFQSKHNEGKGWFAGPWNHDLNLALGFANLGVDEPHFHHTPGLAAEQAKADKVLVSRSRLGL